MSVIGIIGLLLSLVLLAVTVYRGWHITISSFFAVICIIVLCGVNPLEAISAYYTAWGGFATSFLGKMMFAAIFAKLYEQSGAAAAIAEAIARIIFRENMGQKGKIIGVMSVGILSNLVLTYGGVGAVLCVYLTIPIFMPLMEKVNIPRRFGVSALVIGALVLGNVGPGAPVNPNVVGANLVGLGATAMSASISAFITMAAEFVACCLILCNMILKAQASGERFEYGPSFKPLETKKKPMAIYALIPMVVVLVLYNALHLDITLSLIVGCLLAIVMFWSWLPTKEGFAGFNGKVAHLKGATGAAIINTLAPLNSMSSINGFAAVMKLSAAYGTVIAGIEQLNMSPYLLIIVVTMGMCLVVAGNSVALQLSLPIVAPIASAAGVSPHAITRIAIFAGSTFDTVPYSGTLNLFASLCDCTMKEIYPAVFLTSVVVPIFGTALCTLLCMSGIV